MSSSRFALAILYQLLSSLLVESQVTQLNSGNLRETLSQSELVLINFYADWCRFSQMLAPIFDDAEKHVRNNIDPTRSRVTLAKVDCEVEHEIAREYGVSKYPTMKLFRFGEMSKKEYRGQRSFAAIVNYVEEQLRDALQIHTSASQLDSTQLFSSNARVMIAYVRPASTALSTMQRVASQYRASSCSFHALLHNENEDWQSSANNWPISMQLGNDEWVGAVNSDSSSIDRYVGQLDDTELLATFVLNKCEPLVRELTFENAEELAEEGLPFLLLFYHPDYDASDLRRRFKAAVEKEVAHERYNINFLTADGRSFEHPLHHMGKAVSDLPLIVIDSFKHLYLFPHSVRDFLETPNGQLKQFVDDHNSGKLHQELHDNEHRLLQAQADLLNSFNMNDQQIAFERAMDDFKQDNTDAGSPPDDDVDDDDDDNDEDVDGDDNGDNVDHDVDGSNSDDDVTVRDSVVDTPNKQVFESVFKKLGPSKQRYTLIKEEL